LFIYDVIVKQKIYKRSSNYYSPAEKRGRKTRTRRQGGEGGERVREICKERRERESERERARERERERERER
jgi:hypothetical protein